MRLGSVATGTCRGDKPLITNTKVAIILFTFKIALAFVLSNLFPRTKIAFFSSALGPMFCSAQYDCLWVLGLKFLGHSSPGRSSF